MAQVRPLKCLPWVVASMVAPAVFVSLYLVVGLVQLGGFVSPATGLAFAETYSLVDTPVLVAVLLLAGFLFYRSYPSSLKTVFGVCATTSAFAILSIELYGIVVSGFAGTPNQSLAVLLYVLNSALDGTVAAALITVGALISRKWTADRR